MSKKNYSIQFLRFLFCIGIVNYHFFSLFLRTTSLPNYFCRGYIGDEFFYMVAGFFVAQTTIKAEGSSVEWSIKYLWRRIKKIAVLYYSSWLFCFVGRRVVDCIQGRDVDLVKRLCNSIYELLFLEMFGFTKGEYSNSVSWFFSALLISIAVICPLLCHFKRIYLLWIAPVVALFGLGGLSIQYDYLFYPHKVIAGLPVLKGMVRAFVGVNIGVFIYGIIDFIRKRESTRRECIILKMLACCIWGGIFAYMIYPFRSNYDTPTIQYDYVFTLLIALALILTFYVDAKTHAIEKKSEKIADQLGRFSVYVFFGQPIVYSIGEWYFELPIRTIYKFIGLHVLVLVSSLILYVVNRVFVEVKKHKEEKR